MGISVLGKSAQCMASLNLVASWPGVWREMNGIHRGRYMSQPIRMAHTPFLRLTSQFDPDCFDYILTFWSTAQTAFYGTPTSPGLFHAQQLLAPSTDVTLDPSQNPLLSKQAIIVLREELEFFSITRPGAVARTDLAGNANEELRELKRACGQQLAERRAIFTALQRNVNKENNQAEQHLIDMLCMR
jgi:hypothetical protein